MLMKEIHLEAAFAIGNNKIVVGANGNDDDGGSSGSVYVYDLDGTNEIKITPSDGQTNTQFGRSVAIANGKLIVGAWGSESGTSSGSTYVYDLDGTNEIKITPSDGAFSDGFGYAVAVTSNGGGVNAINITDGGSHYKQATPPTVTITGGGGTGATATAAVSSTGLVNSILITSSGTGYTSAPTVTIDYSPKDNRAEVKSWDSTTRALEVYNRNRNL